MAKSTIWNTLAAAAALAGMSMTGAPTCAAAPSPAADGPSTGGADTQRVQTNGSTAIHTAPRGTAEIWTFGPDVPPAMVWLVAD